MRTKTYYWLLLLLCSCYSLYTTAQPNITKVEYYIDTDPGLGSGTNIGISPNIDLTNQTLNLDLSTLNSGIHKLILRAKDANGLWSHNNAWLFVKAFPSLAPGALNNITNVEYYVDTDPGFGNATVVSVATGTDIANTALNLDISSLVTGIHKLILRAKDANGTWSNNNTWVFAKAFPSLAPGAVPNITKVEYYIDIDPGLGNATVVNGASGGTDLANLPINLDPALLNTGIHKLIVRSLDANGTWSNNNAFVFAKAFPSLAPGAVPNITAVEYYLDYDPGYGKGKPIAITAGTDLSNLTFNVDITGIVSGTHYAIVRAKDANGTWSHLNNLPFTIPGTPPAMTTTVSANNICGNTTITVGAAVSGVTFNADNVFVVQLSDASGSFTNPTEIGKKASTSGFNAISATIPANIPYGSSYKIRTFTTSQTILGADNGSGLTLIPLPTIPTITPTKDTSICQGASAAFTATNTSGNYQWLVNSSNVVASGTGSTYTTSVAGAYSVKVSSYNNSACSVTSTPINLSINPNTPTTPTITPGTTAVCFGDNLVFTSSSTTGNQWLLNGSPIAGETGATFTTQSPGGYSVRVSNGSGCIATSATSIITLTFSAAPSVSLTASATSIAANMPVTFTAAPNLGGTAPSYVFKVNGTVMQSGSSNTFTTSTLVNGATVTCIMTSNATCATTPTASSNSIGMSVTGIVILPLSGGSLNATGKTIPSITLRISGDITDSVVTDGNGRYNYNFQAFKNYTITPYKNNDVVKASGINVLDVLQTQSHILSKVLLGTPYKIIAADVNSDANINVLDVLLIKRLILGKDTTFSGNKLWAFVDSAQVFADPTNPFPFSSSKTFNNLSLPLTNQSFIGMKLGDVNQDWAPVIGVNGIKPFKNIQLYYDTINTGDNNVLRLRVRVKGFKDVMGMQFTLGFKATDLQLVGIDNLGLPWEYNALLATKGVVPFIWADAKNLTNSLADGTALFDIVLQKQGGFTSDSLSINPNYTPALAYGTNYEPLGVVMGSIAISNSLVTVADNSIYVEQVLVAPNPSKGVIQLRITAKQSQSITINITDVLGRTIVKKQMTVAAGLNDLPLNLEVNGTILSGVYYLKVEGLEKVFVKQILVQK